jgi:hypothetical protein
LGHQPTAFPVCDQQWLTVSPIELAMISSNHSSEGAGRMSSVRMQYQTVPRPLAPKPVSSTFASDSISLSTGRLGQPAIRSDIVARARLLAADPSYPPRAILRQVAERLLATELS